MPSPRLRLRWYVFEESPTEAWQAGARAFGASICRVHAESRSGRQSRDGRASWASGDDGSTQNFRGVVDDVAVYPNVVSRRGMERVKPVSVLHRPPGFRAR